jgi:hypothetical protein
MMQMITGHWVSQTVGTLARLGVADAIADGANTSAAVANKCGSNPAATRRLLRTATSLGLLIEEPPDTFKLTPVGETLRANLPGSLRDFAVAETDQAHWLSWGRMAEAVTSGKPAAPNALGQEIFQWYESHPQDAAAFAGAMGNLTAMVAEEVANCCDFSTSTKIVDVGGSHGVLLATVLKRNPGLSGILFDLPEVAKRARDALDKEGLAGRAEAVGGDFFAEVPGGDVYLLKQILHDWNDDQCRTILSKCANRLQGRGKVLIIEMIIPDDNSPSMASLVDMNMLVMLPGRERSLAEYRALLAAAGLRLDRVIQTHSPFQVIEASKNVG